jgi:putative protease
MEEIGVVEHYFTKIGVAAIRITNGKLSIGDTITVKGSTTDFEQRIDSMEVERQRIEEARVGDAIGIKVAERVREGDRVYKVE